MSNQADIRDIQILSDLKAGFGRFGEDVLQILASLQKQFEEIQEELEGREDHWREQVEEAQEEIYSARQSLRECINQPVAENDNAPDCSFEEERVADAERSLAESRKNLETVKRWRHRIKCQIADFQNEIHRLSNLATVQTSSAQACLANKIEILHRYVGGMSSGVRTTGLQGGSGDGRIYDRAITPELTNAEKQALRRYTGFEFRQINKTFREGLHDEVALRLGELLSQALAKLPTYRGTVYRGVTLDVETIDKYTPGQIVLEKQFISTSTQRDVADEFGKEKPRVVFIIQSKNGKSIAGASEHARENEVLFVKGTQFKVLDRKFINDVWVILEEEV